jgi:TatA/E family protein of Tat protein translocase
MNPILGEIVGWEALLILGLIATLFGSSRLPKLARSLAQAHKEFQKGLAEEPNAESDPPDQT